jgi:hypothetical protein
VRACVPLLLLVAVGCSGGPLKEIPVFEPPPPADPAPEVERTPTPAAPAPESAALVGAWRSTTVSGPGSASISRVVLVFDGDGGVSGAAFGPSNVTSLAGTYTDLDGAVRVDLGGGDVRLWVKDLEPGLLVLREGDQELRLVPLR